MPAAYWQTTYAADRRKQRHRCRRCNRIVDPGEDVYMARVSGPSSGRRCRSRIRVLHIACGQRMAGNDVTELQLLESHGMQYLARRGFATARRWLDDSPLTKMRNAGYD